MWSRLATRVVSRGLRCRRNAHVWSDQPQEWKHRLQVAAIIERCPVINTEYNDFENLYIKHWLQMNEEKTELNTSEFEEHGVKFVGKKQVKIEQVIKDRDERLAREEEERKYQGTKGLAGTGADAIKDFEFVPAPKLTEDEHDHRSLNRRLMGHLYLICKDKETGLWRFPQGPYRTTDGQYLRLSAKRHLQEHIGKRLRVHMIGNVPMHVITEPEEIDNKPVKTFFFHGRYRVGEVKWNLDKIETHAWVNMNEMREYFGDEYFNLIRPMIFIHNDNPSPHIAEMS